jgi:hypothetical protein
MDWVGTNETETVRFGFLWACFERGVLVLTDQPGWF